MKKITNKWSISLIIVAMLFFIAMPISTFAMVATHTVTFYSNGGSTVESQTVYDGDKAIEPAKPTNSGYSFQGWYDSSLTTKFDFNTAITEDVTLYAKWSKIKDVYVDNTTDTSISYVIGRIIAKDNKTGETTLEEVFNQSFTVTYSNPKTPAVMETIDTAYNMVYNKAKEKGEDVKMSVDESTGKVWDNRKYETVEDGDAVLIGDADYLTGAYGVNDDYTRTHIASGDYGKETFYVITANVEFTSDTEYKILLGDKEYTIGSNSNLYVKANGDIDKFAELKIDNEVLDESNYTVESGSTIAKLKSSYLDTLEVGTHNLTFVYEDGEVTTDFIVKIAELKSDNATDETKITETTKTIDKTNKEKLKEKNKVKNPKTGDNIIIWICLMTVSILGILGVMGTIRFRKKNKQ